MGHTQIIDPKLGDDYAITIIAAARAWKGRSGGPENSPARGHSQGRASREWQQEVWELSRQIPELSFYLSWHHNAASRVRLRAVEIDDEGNVTDTDNVVARDIANSFAGGQDGVRLLLAAAVTHLAAVGETYTWIPAGVEIEEPKPGTIDEKTVAGDGGAEALCPGVEVQWDETRGWRVEDAEGMFRDLGPNDILIRAWEPDPTRRIEPWSPMQSALPILRELASLTALVGAEADSRLSAGLLLWPQSHALPGGVEKFTETLIDQLSTPIRDRASASSVVPLPLPMPDEVIDKVRHIRFGMDLSEQTKQLRDESVRRFAMGARIPPEVLTGMGDVTHWGQWFIDEQGIKVFVAPEVHIVINSWTRGWYQPALAAAGIKDWDKHFLWPDLTQLVLRPDRSADALGLFDRLLLSGDAVLRETGFDLTDKPSQEEMLQQLIINVARTAPSSIVDLLPLLPGMTPELAAQLRLSMMDDTEKAAMQREGAPLGDPGIDEGVEPTESSPGMPTDEGAPTNLK